MTQKDSSFLTIGRFRIEKWLYTFAALVILFAVTPSIASAHASVVRSEPEDGAVLAEAPTVAQFWFDEPTIPRFSSTHLVDQNNETIEGVFVDGAWSDADGMRITLPTLEDGTYTLFWKVLSDVDGHFSQGFTTFTVGQTTSIGENSIEASTEQPALSLWSEILIRWGNLGFLAGIIGALALVHFVLTPVGAQQSQKAIAAQQKLVQKLLDWVALCALGALLFGLGLLIWQGWQSREFATVEESWGATLQFLITQSRWGLFWTVRQLLLIVLAAGLWFLGRRPLEESPSWLRLAIFGRVIDLAIVQALSGHALASGTWILAVASSAVHLIGAGVWLGGLFAMAVFVLPAMHRNQSVNNQWKPMRWRSFSLLAFFSFGLLLATGLFNTGQQIASVDALIETTYGQLLLGKLGLILFIALLGLVNSMMLHPVLAAPLAKLLKRQPGWTPAPLRNLPRLIGLEVIIGLLILGVTGGITSTQPPVDVRYTINPDDVPQQLGQRIDDLFVSLAVKPNRPGKNLFDIRSANLPEARSDKILSVSVNFTYLGNRGIAKPETVALADKIDPGLYQLTGQHLTRPGPWRIDIITTRNNRPNQVTSFDWVVPPAGELAPVVVSKYPLVKVLTPVAIAILLLVLAGWLLVRRAPKKNPGGDVDNQPISTLASDYAQVN